jgi:hypothetical protein
VQLEVTLQFRIDDPSTAERHIFSKKVNAQLAQVPRVGEAVVIPAERDGVTLNARRVSEVVYTLQGGVILTFDLDGLGNSVDEQAAVLRRAGFVD